MNMVSVSTAPESPTPSVEDDFDTNEVAPSLTDFDSRHSDVAIPKANGASTTTKQRRIGRLSTVSRMYDVDGDGELDEAELAMRNMDKSGRGHLSNETVYKMMQEQIKTQQQLFQVKRIMFVLLAIVVVLAVSNLGTSFAAAYLAKDTTTNESFQLVDKRTGEELSTQTSTEDIELERTVINEDTGSRRLATEFEYNTSSLTIPRRLCNKLKKNCNRGRQVTLKRTWGNGDVSRHTMCPFRRGKISRSLKSILENELGQEVILKPEENGHCEISGDAVRMRQGEICQVNNDCADNLTCMKVPAFIESCQWNCAKKRWVERMKVQCQWDCDVPSCEVAEVDE